MRRIVRAEKRGRRMDVDLTIRYSDDHLCEIVVCQPSDETPLYRIATRRAHLGESITEAMREARRPYEITPWPIGGGAAMLERLDPT
jgi:hypothetical protein